MLAVSRISWNGFFNTARGGQGINFPLLEAFNVFVFDTPLLAAE